jgi:hypothetical protein
MFYTATTSNAINPRTGKVWTDDDVVNAYIDFVKTVKQTLGPNRIVVGNGIYNGNHFYRTGKHERILRFLSESQIDGIISEGWVSQYSSPDWYSEGLWLMSMNFTTWLEDNFLSQNKILMICAENAGLEWAGGPLSDGTYPTNLPSGVTKDQYGTYVFASLLLVARSGGEYINFGYYILESYPQSLFKIDLGNPVGAYSVVSGTHIYARDFSKVKVLVNPTFNSYTVILDGNYLTFDGKSVVSPITVAPHTGIILKKV